MNTRQASSNDGALIAHHRYAASNGSDDDRRVYARWVEGAIARGVYLGRFALGDDGAVLAGAGAQLIEWGPILGDASPLRARIVNVFTEPKARRQGLARSLVTSLIATLRDEHAIGTFTLASTAMSDPLYAHSASSRIRPNACYESQHHGHSARERALRGAEPLQRQRGGAHWRS